MRRPRNLCRTSTRLAAAAAVAACGLAAAIVSAGEPSLDTDTLDSSAGSQQDAHAWGTGEDHSFLVPALEIPTFQLLLNRYDHYAIDQATYPSPLDNFRNNQHRSWVVDNDKFSTNQFLHPYQGSTYQGFARSAGLTFWQASAYTFAGSLVWEEAGENTAPSINDQIATGIGGNFLGEPLFRIASLLLEQDAEQPHWWRELAAGIVSPPTAINRFVFGDRFTPIFPSNHPEVFTSFDVS